MPRTRRAGRKFQLRRIMAIARGYGIEDNEAVSKALKSDNLHDNRIINGEKLPSNSVLEGNINKLEPNNSLAFVQDSHLEKSTFSNINDEEKSNGNICENNEDSQDTSTSGDDHIRKDRCTSEHNHLKRIANELNQPLPNNVVLPPPPKEDYIDVFLKLFGRNLRKLSLDKQKECMQQSLQQCYEMFKR